MTDAIKRIENRYDADFDLIPNGPAVTWAEMALAQEAKKLRAEIEGLKGDGGNVTDRERELAQLAADLAALVLDLSEALADWHAGTSTTRPYAQTFERDEKLLDRTAALVTEARAALGDLGEGA